MTLDTVGEAPRVMTRDMLEDVPNQPKTPRHTVRVPDDLWLAAKEVAEQEGDNLSEVIRDALRRYVKRKTSARRTAP